jgi:hypothetical protein
LEIVGEELLYRRPPREMRGVMGCAGVLGDRLDGVDTDDAMRSDELQVLGIGPPSLPNILFLGPLH